MFEGEPRSEPDIVVLLDRAKTAIAALDEGFHALSVDPGNIIALALSSVTALETEPFRFYWCGHLLECPLTDLGQLPTILPALLARAYGVTEQDAREFLSFFGETEPLFHNETGQPSFGVFVSCNHPGCRMRTSVRFSTPPEMLEAKSRAVRTIWFCHHHLKVAWENEGALPDFLLTILSRVQQQPGISLSASGANHRDIDFLERIGLLRSTRVTSTGAIGPIRRFSLEATTDGEHVLRKLCRMGDAKGVTADAGEPGL